MHLSLDHKGFTLIELAVVAAVLVILAVVSMSTFTSSNQITESHLGMMEQVVGTINAAAKAKLSNEIAQGQLPGPSYLYQVLDNTSNYDPASPANPKFTNYLNPPITDPSWKMVFAGCYQHDSDASGTFTTNDACMAWSPSQGRAWIWAGGDGCSSLSCNANPF